jgi:hypothetical protein
VTRLPKSEWPDLGSYTQVARPWRVTPRGSRGGGTMADTFRIVNEDTVFTLPWEVGIQEGLFRRAGCEVEVGKKNPGNTAQGLFERNKEVLYESGKVDAFKVCESVSGNS